jgi:hypothetical protein
MDLLVVPYGGAKGKRRLLASAKPEERTSITTWHPI